MTGEDECVEAAADETEEGRDGAGATDEGLGEAHARWGGWEDGEGRRPTRQDKERSLEGSRRTRVAVGQAVENSDGGTGAEKGCGRGPSESGVAVLRRPRCGGGGESPWRCH